MNPVGGIGGGGSIEQIIALRQQIIDRSKVLTDLHQAKPAAPSEAGGIGGAQAQPTSFGDSLKGALDSVNAAQSRSGELTAAYERGETTDIAKAMAEGVRGGLEAVAVTGPGDLPITPCGRCRQVLNELAQLGGTDPEVLCVGPDTVQRVKLSDLLPHAFGPASLT